VYIHDYLKQRKWDAAAREFAVAANLDPLGDPPIVSHQGLLFESVRSRRPRPPACC
jgi:hypothetical protein